MLWEQVDTLTATAQRHCATNLDAHLCPIEEHPHIASPQARPSLEARRSGRFPLPVNDRATGGVNIAPSASKQARSFGRVDKICFRAGVFSGDARSLSAKLIPGTLHSYSSASSFLLFATVNVAKCIKQR